MKVAGDIPLDRGNVRSAVRSLKMARKAVLQGYPLVIFPEGGRSLDGELQPFLGGAFRLAIDAQLPVIPVAIQGTREALRPGSLLLRGGSVRVAFGRPISTKGLGRKHRDELRRAVESTIRSMLSPR
jgi:1-acyl-sn-glycerol-3-phosphate acyltransferase